ncbi:hypothetical protein CY34DRAFT_800046 [Suillus luteus UH-Slu-Lm8-n1]|uniref:Uncharacterized protein n=1 Tax=Suillus luteus UH-Slu-Lm8-n1 TaxID=930992 RepID=A0A0D0A952_9AGAM|nr:hypothetical protein CY34DRAFT_800046 [Suillus luteus UH-Slu-Lm8-n1]
MPSSTTSESRGSYLQFGDQDAMNYAVLGHDIIFSRLIVTLEVTSAVERGNANDFLNFHIINIMSTGRSLLVVTRVARTCGSQRFS